MLKSRSRAALRTTGISVILLGLVAFVAWRLDWHAMLGALVHASLLVLLFAAAVNALSLACKGVRWWIFLRREGEVPLALVLRATLAGASLNNMLIAQGGEAARVIMIARRSGISVAAVTRALALERSLDAVSYVLLVVLATWSFPGIPEAIMRWRMHATGVIGLCAVVFVVVSARRARAARAFGSAMLLSLIAWALQVATYYAVARATHLDITLGASIAAQLAVGLSFLVRATPGNVGVFQAIYAATLLPFGVAQSAAIATALLIQFVQVVPITIIGGALTKSLLGPQTQELRA